MNDPKKIDFKEVLISFTNIVDNATERFNLFLNDPNFQESIRRLINLPENQKK